MEYVRIFIGGMIALLLFSCGAPNEEEQPSLDQTTGDPRIDRLSEKIRNNPEDAGLYYTRGLAYYRAEGYDQALLDLTTAIDLDSTRPVYFHALADTYMDYFKSFQALQTMNLAAERFPDDIPTLLKLSEYQLILKKHEDSFRTIDQILQQDPQNAEAYFMFGMNFRELKDTVRAINSFQSAVEFDPDLTDAWILLGQLYQGLGDPLALQYFENALRVDSLSVAAYHAKAVYLNDLGKPLEALEVYREINLRFPQYEDAYFNAGLIYLDQDSIDKAYQQFDLLIRVSPIHIQGYYYRGLTEELSGHPEKARQDYEQALKFAPNYTLPKEGLQRLERELQPGNTAN